MSGEQEEPEQAEAEFLCKELDQGQCRKPACRGALSGRWGEAGVGVGARLTVISVSLEEEGGGSRALRSAVVGPPVCCSGPQLPAEDSVGYDLSGGSRGRALHSFLSLKQ